MTTTANELQTKGDAARRAARELARTSTDVKNRALEGIADSLLDHADEIIAANVVDVQGGKGAGLTPAVIDRLTLNHERLAAIATDTRAIAVLPDPVGEMIDMKLLPNGMQVGRRRVPLGVIAAIYESRPNVTVDIAALCLKSGNATILRGGKETINSNKVIVSVLREAIAAAGGPGEAVQLIENTDRGLIGELLAMKDTIDLVVPRGGAELIRFVAENATMPVLTGGIGVCHTYVDRAADLDKAVAIALNAKTRKVSICNALDTLIVHADIAASFLPEMARAFAGKEVEMRGDERALAILREANAKQAVAAGPEDFDTEFLSLTAAIRVVDSLDEALEHIHVHGTGHSDAIVTEDYSAAMRFLDEVDSAVCYVNASTQFTDGAQFGLGAEIIDSTQKTIARGPVGLREITTYKWIVLGSGQIRP
ncbi:MAG: glutamate-5-semialdehyde dehydrogenase [Chloroflexi bacterium]|nr:glutamate-5-semialdehyde dehydrogenase [Chloroflexota bacterium]MCH7953310.1 glutamate-5-semialdehyde dehydrogenase [Chloroflexota bacterium]MCI0784156.1 glutamate-5-semialdehyde dehydrogenase [Chloroflexota bacterium]MCI0817793.1 glutamate-5-semialdehyde dehydrogenase [Chloroflexota bacterium]MCI0818997.1 glutamate-5-semialdehyde dehydrogenase [Chloroflexota bacterium]